MGLCNVLKSILIYAQVQSMALLGNKAKQVHRSKDRWIKCALM